VVSTPHDLSADLHSDSWKFGGIARSKSGFASKRNTFRTTPLACAPHPSETTPLHRFWRDRTWMQDRHRITTQTVRDVLTLRGAIALLALLANRPTGRSNNTGRSASESHDLHKLWRAPVRDIRDKRIDLCLTIGHTDIQAPSASEVKDGIGESGEERHNRGPRQIAKAFRD